MSDARTGRFTRRWVQLGLPMVVMAVVLFFLSTPVATGQSQPKRAKPQANPSSAPQKPGSAKPPIRPVGTGSGSAADASSATLLSGPKPVLMGWASVASFQQIQQLSKDAGFKETPAFVSPSTIEQKSPFLDPGSIATNQPLAMGFFGGKAIDLRQGAVILIPMRPGKGSLQSLLSRGATPVGPDACALGPVTFRATEPASPRSGNYFVFGFLRDQVRYAKPEVFAAPYQGGSDDLAHLMIDLKAIRQAYAKEFAAWLNLTDQQAAAKGGESGRFGAKLVSDPLRELDRVHLSIDRPDRGLRLAVRLQPLALDPAVKPASGFERPGFPDSILFRADFAYPPRKVFTFVDVATERMVAEGWESAFRRLTPEQRARGAAFLKQLVGLFLDGEAASFAADPVLGKDGKMTGTVFYVVSHRPGGDIGRVMRELGTQGDVLGRQLRQGPLAQLTAYTAGDGATKVWRLSLNDNNGPMLYVDAVQRGPTAYLAVTDSDGHFVERLLAPGLKPLGPLPNPGSTLASGWVSPGAILRPMANTPSGAGGPPNPVAELSPGDRAALLALVGDHKLTWAATATADRSMTFDVTVSPKLLANTAKISQIIERTN